MIPEELITAYREAKYVVLIDDNEVVFRVGKSCDPINQLLKDQSSKTAFFITAHNPKGEVMTEDKNKNLHEDLLQDMRSRSLSFFEGYGTDDEEKWGREKSLLILGISKNDADKMAKKYQQNAYIWIEENQNTELVIM